MRTWAIFSALLALLCGTICYAAGIPQTLNYQGTLQTSTGQPVNTPQDITFSLYNTPLGAETPFWTETLSKVPASNGQFSVTLGTTTPIDPSKFTGTTYIGIKVGTQPEMTPRQKMTSVAYAFKAVEAQTALSAQTAAFATTATGVVPSGGIIMWSGIKVPTGWALCDGSNGTPDLREKFIMGASTTYPTGVTGGEASHTLTISEMPSHTHIQNEHSHTTSQNYAHSQGSNPSGTGGPGGYLWHQNSNSINSSIAINQNTGGGQPLNNLPPYYALAFIMKL